MDKPPSLQCELRVQGGMSGFFSIQVVSFSLGIFCEFYGLQRIAVSVSHQGWHADGPTTAMAENSVATRQMYPETELSQHKRRGSAKLPPNKNRHI